MCAIIPSPILIQPGFISSEMADGPQEVILEEMTGEVIILRFMEAKAETTLRVVRKETR